MDWASLAFYLIATVCVLSAAGVVISPNPVHSAIFLILCFLNIAATFVLLGAEFLAVAQVIVYTGAILVLLLFVLMLVDTEKLPDFHTGQPVQRVVGLILGLILLLEIGAAIVARSIEGQPGSASRAEVEAVGGNTQALGRVLYDDNLLAFISVSLVLTVAVIGAIVLALPDRVRGTNKQRGTGTINLGHPVGADGTPLALPQVRGEAPIPPMAPGTLRPVGADRRIVMVSDPDTYNTVGQHEEPLPDLGDDDASRRSLAGRQGEGTR
ncbi:MAG TPA: NADH-quinone oxidoreductase subunit J [Thermomicrobiales bacterium]|jgi:NADH-quinone oxidoreductase subunit J|nr:NADH-quinone oxidoreductase subunit J [Thermomicrobiales bacterium]